MNPHDLMEVARALAEPGRAPPAQARLRRAVGAARCAMSRRPAASAAGPFIDVRREPGEWA